VNTLTASPSVQKVMRVLDGVFTIVSVVAVTILISSAVIWSLEQPPVQYLKAHNFVEASRGDFIEVSTPVSFRTDSRRANYHLSIRDKQGTPVYIFPEQKLTSSNKDFKLDNYQMQVPNLPSGEYTVHAKLSWWFNPFKDGTADFELTTLVVEPSPAMAMAGR